MRRRLKLTSVSYTEELRTVRTHNVKEVGGLARQRGLAWLHTLLDRRELAKILIWLNILKEYNRNIFDKIISKTINIVWNYCMI